MKLSESILNKIKAMDTFGTYKRLSDGEILMRYFRKKSVSIEESLGDISEEGIFKIRLFYESVAYFLEKNIGIEINICADISREGFGKIVIYSGDKIINIFHLRNLHRFGFNSIDEIDSYGDEILFKLKDIYPEIA
ncbi:DUF269 domain-containing protein [Calditerrivibrio nitroreducens]|uniref:Nitrogen fixation protein n=1 Tax=Calditerrivibrio nitroreducens (strain DSM 19672 / NBRC 101217 / Yu37-1) TaxID=768670 RepID=E4TG42_CALNY|nr:DUF269 domain-containing protein [Calditerrivibrio nitroreducens]ADR18592.1 nitrogen fixation protein [Calditerrivibrio nitroreducens DSM 19672]